jgi:mRNA-degrading endonuclease RelE of RelBE toxin-antitoxin system
VWNVKLTPLAQRELKQLEEDIREDAVSLLLDLQDGIFPSNRVQLENYERYERVKFARNQFRIVYRINRKHRTILVTRIRPRDKDTYSGL